MSVGNRRNAPAKRTAAQRQRRTAQPWPLLAIALTFVTSSLVAGAALAKAPGGCSKRHPCSTPPVVAISAPTSGSVATGKITVAGTASGSTAITKVVVSVDGASPEPAAGTNDWTDALDTTTYAN